MTARPILVVCAEPALGDQLAAALAAIGDVVVHAGLETIVPEARAALCVLHVAGDPAAVVAARLPRCPVIAVLPRTGLFALVALMERCAQVAGALLAEAFDPAQLAQLAQRVLDGDASGLGAWMAAELHVREVGDFKAKSLCLAEIADFVASTGAPSTAIEPIEQSIDEMLMNALYDAPIDAAGKRVFHGVPTRERIRMRTNQHVTVQYAFDGTRFGVSVRDAFGALERDTVLRYLHKSLVATEAVDRRLGGAGLGLYLMATAATAVMFSVVPGVATEVTCLFELRRPAGSAALDRGLERFGFVVHDPAGRPTTPPARRIVLVRPRLRRAMWLAGAAVIVAAGSVALWRALHPETAATIELTSTNGAAIDVDGQPIGIAIDGRLAVPHLLAGRPYRVVARLPGYEPRRAVVTPHAGTNELAFALDAAASVIVDSQPSAATVTIDGLAVGSTPLELATLAPGTTVSIAFDHPGYRHATARVQVPGRGHQQHVVQALEPAPEAVRVHVTSTPPGAAIVRDGQLPTSDRTYTPADVFVDADRVQHFTLVMSKHSPFAIPPFTPGRDTPSVQVGGELR